MNGGEFGIIRFTNSRLANKCDMEESSAFAGGVMLSDKKVVEQVGTHGGIYARISLP